jgi:hypothetical protein
MLIQEDESLGKQCNRRVVSADQEAWMKKRLEEFVLLLKDIYRREIQFPGAADSMINGSIHGAIEGLSIELIRILGCEPCFVNIKKWIDEGLDWSLRESKNIVKMSEKEN